MQPPNFGFADNSNDSKSKPSGGIQSGNDYFNENGTYLFTDAASSNEIRIIKGTVWDLITSQIPNYSKCDGKDEARLSQMLLKSSMNLKRCDLGADDGEILLGGICDYYYNKMGIEAVNTGSDYGTNSLAHSLVDSKGDRKVAISVYNGQLSAPELGENKMNFINVLIHEQVHYFDHFEEVKGPDGKSEAHYLGVELEDDGGSERHLESFWAQVNHWSWEKADVAFKTWELKKVGMYLTGLNKNDPYKSNDLKLKFEKKCRFHFDEIGNNATRNTIIWD